MKPLYRIELLDEAVEYLNNIDKNAREKILFNLRKSQIYKDKTLFKKLSNEIWEFRTLFNRTQYRLFAFWDKTDKKSKEMKTTSLDVLLDDHIGKVGTKKRDKFENELRLDIIGETIKQARKERKLTQEQLGKLVGVKKAQISKIENNLTDARFETILKVFRALNAKIHFNVELQNQNVELI
jgi:DNA-binding XRE family transcriptional regulator